MIASWWLLPGQALLLNEIAILALFAVSLDLILGYAGIVSLGHAAFFGFGAYGAALFAKHVMPDPLVGLAVAIALSAALGALTSLLILRGTDLTRLMVTLGVASVLYELANKLDDLTGGADGLQGVVDGPAARPLRVRPRTAAPPMPTAWRCCSSLFLLARRLVHSPFGVSLQALRDNRCAPRASASRSTRAWSRSTRSARRSPAPPARCSRRRPASRRSTCWTSTAPPTCCWCW